MVSALSLCCHQLHAKLDLCLLRSSRFLDRSLRFDDAPPETGARDCQLGQQRSASVDMTFNCGVKVGLKHVGPRSQRVSSILRAWSDIYMTPPQ
jgi:hypothetical protein